MLRRISRLWRAALRAAFLFVGFRGRRDHPAARCHVEVGIAGLQVVPGRDQRAVPQPAGDNVRGEPFHPIGLTRRPEILEEPRPGRHAGPRDDLWHVVRRFAPGSRSRGTTYSVPGSAASNSASRIGRNSGASGTTRTACPSCPAVFGLRTVSCLSVSQRSRFKPSLVVYRRACWSLSRRW
jgi:hypothetical protein